MTTRIAFVSGAFVGAVLGGLLVDFAVIVPGGRPDLARAVVAGLVYLAAANAAWVVYWHAYDRGAAAHRSRP